MNKSFHRIMWGSATLSGILALVCALFSLTSLAITFGTVFYHFAMRLTVGGIVPILFRKVSHNHPWFRQRSWEKALYRRLGVKKWKKHIPTYDPESFSLEHHTPGEILQNMCISELVHEGIMLCSFLPLAAVPIFGEFWVFFLTSLAAAMLDGIFVALQRFNRPRVEKLLR